MKKLLPVFTVFLIALFTQSCLKDKLTRTYSIYVPVYKEKSEVYNNISSNPAREVKAPGKIFLYGNYIFLNEVDKGIHVIDNSNPSHPVIKAFIDIPGNLDIAVKGNTLYADLYSDLVLVDISNPLQAQFIRYVPNVFPERNYSSGFIADSSRIIVDWIRRDTTVDLNSGYGRPCTNCLYASDAMNNSFLKSSAAGAFAPGIGGSMARFSLVNNHLYTVNNWSLGVFDISAPNDAQRISTVNLNWGIETIYPFRNKLFIGSQTGMFIYDISNPAVPVREGQFIHARACDPVISDGDYAYVTLRDGTLCSGFNNQLDVVDVRNIMSPVLLRTYAMSNPHGLSKSGNLLFVCDGKDGLKIYDAAVPASISLKKHITGIEPFDAIAWNNNLVVTASDGLYQYDYSNPQNITLRSRITVNK